MITEEDYKKLKRLEDLKRYGNNLREDFPNRTNQSFFEFREPVPGCKYNIGKARGEIIIPMKQTDLSMFYSEIHRCLYKTPTQLVDNIRGSLDFSIISVTDWHQNNDDTIFPRTERTAYKLISSRNQIILLCDETVNELTAKLLIPMQRSGLSFNRGVLMKIDYRIDRTKIKKKRGGSYIDHQSIQCFTKNVRKDDIKRMYNYTKGSDSYIFNIMNQNDDLCFKIFVSITP